MQERARIRKLRCFVDFRPDAFVKVGGSLAKDRGSFRKLALVLAQAAERARIIAFPGGGPTDKVIEEFNAGEALKPGVHHQACARAQDQTGLLFSNFSERIVPVEEFASMAAALEEGKLPVLLPSRLLFALEPVEKTWEITSDTIGAYFAWLVEAPQYVILKSIDGIPKPGRDGGVYSEISASELEQRAGDEVDAILPGFLKAAGMRAVILNGRDTDRVAAFFRGETVPATRILPE